MNSLEQQSYQEGAFSDQMYAHYGEAFTNDILGNLREAPLSHQGEGASITYVRLGEGPSVFYVPGFTENLIGKASSAIELSQWGFDVIMPHYDSSPTLKNDAGKRDPTMTRA